MVNSAIVAKNIVSGLSYVKVAMFISKCLYRAVFVKQKDTVLLSPMPTVCQQVSFCRRILVCFA